MNLIIPAKFERKLMAYVNAVDGEIAGMGEVEMRDDGNLWVTDIAIYDQEVTGGTADLSSEALASFMTELIQKGKSPKNWYLWWHSHANMGAFFSTIDTGTIESSTEFDHILSLVVNKRGERKCRLDMHRPFRMTLDNIMVQVQPEANEKTRHIDEQIFELLRRAEELEKERKAIEAEMPEGIEAEVREKVRQKVWRLPPRHVPARGGKDFLLGDFDDSWSKKRKKDGPVTTKEGIELHTLDKDELEVLIENTVTMLRAHAANGNGDTVEAEELRADLSMYYQQLVELTVAELGISDEDMGTTGHWEDDEWVVDREGTPILGLDDVPSEYYKLGFKDDERI